MAALRNLQPLVRQSMRVAVRTAPTKRSLNISSAPALATSHATVTGARNGHIKGDALNLELTMPKALGGPGEPGKTNPEELFAAGYGACFQSAMNLVAPTMGVKLPKNAEDSVIETDVHLIGDMKAGDLGIRVDMRVKVKGVSKQDMEKVIEKTKEICPYSRATKGNVITNVEIVET